MLSACCCDVVQDILASGFECRRDASGNPILEDAGVWLKGQIKTHFKEADIKYIDPSYLIRSIPTVSGDRIYCKVSPELPAVIRLPAALELPAAIGTAQDTG